MLAFLSDLHFNDGSGGHQNPNPGAIHLTLKNVADRARAGKAKEVEVVLLGDIFDLLRTEKWFEVDLDARPWGTDTEAMHAQAKSILCATIKQNQKAFEAFGNLASCGFPKNTKITYVIGNHDRLLGVFPDLRKMACEAINADCSEKSLHHYRNEQYGVFARHGHEYDAYNYEGDESYTDDEYNKMPIGDPITTELASTLPGKITDNPEIKRKLEPDAIRVLERNLWEIDNVRPLSATLRWLRFQIPPHSDISGPVEEVLDKSIEAFNEIPAVQDWYKRHLLLGKAKVLYAGLRLAKHLHGWLMGASLSIAEKWEALTKVVCDKDQMAEAAKRDLERAGKGIYFVLYGHTHYPLQIPLRTSPGAKRWKIATVNTEPDCFYINTGAYRPWNAEAMDQEGFVSWRQLTYTLLYTAEESSVGPQNIKEERSYPTFDTWTGNRYSPHA